MARANMHLLLISSFEGSRAPHTIILVYAQEMKQLRTGTRTANGPVRTGNGETKWDTRASKQTQGIQPEARLDGPHL